MGHVTCYRVTVFLCFLTLAMITDQTSSNVKKRLHSDFITGYLLLAFVKLPGDGLQHL